MSFKIMHSHNDMTFVKHALIQLLFTLYTQTYNKGFTIVIYMLKIKITLLFLCSLKTLRIHADTESLHLQSYM